MSSVTGSIRCGRERWRRRSWCKNGAGATVANQYEGGWQESGKGVSIIDVERGASCGVERVIDDEVLEGVLYPSHEATDFYHHYKEDIALFAEMGFTTFRMSIAWTR